MKWDHRLIIVMHFLSSMYICAVLDMINATIYFYYMVSRFHFST